jgi:MoaA/NifB/PqqE/SkfB family radical SAM enzyme
MKLKAERIRKWARGKKQGPVRIELHPTNRCNAHCLFCWQVTNNNPDYSYEMSDERLLKIVDEAHQLGVKEWIISGGGESLVRHDVTMQVLNRIKKYNMWGQLTTNGALFNKKDIKNLVDISWDQIQFSIDGPNAEIHDFLRDTKGIFEKAKQNFKFLSEYKKEKKSSLPYIGFNTVLNRLNYNKLDKMIELAHEVGSQLVYFEPLYPGYLSKERLDLNEKEKKELPNYIRKAVKKAKELGISTNVDRFLDIDLIDKTHFNDTVLNYSKNSKNKFISAPCYQPWYLMGIKANGLAGCCSTFEEGEFVHDKSLKDIWFGKKFDKIRKNMLNKELPDYCKKCSVVVVMDNNEIRKKMMNLPQSYFNKINERIKKWMKK